MALGLWQLRLYVRVCWRVGIGMLVAAYLCRIFGTTTNGKVEGPMCPELEDETLGREWEVWRGNGGRMNMWMVILGYEGSMLIDFVLEMELLAA